MFTEHNGLLAVKQMIQDCAEKLSIDLPEVTHSWEFWKWLNQNPDHKASLFKCVHETMMNPDGSINGEYLLAKISSYLNDEEPELLEELTLHINTCPIITQGRRDFEKCVLRACATP